MRFINDLKIGTRLGIAFAIAIAFTVIVAVYARIQLSSINDEIELLVNDRVVKVEELEALKDNGNQIARSIRNIVILTDEAAMARAC